MVFQPSSSAFKLSHRCSNPISPLAHQRNLFALLKDRCGKNEFPLPQSDEPCQYSPELPQTKIIACDCPDDKTIELYIKKIKLTTKINKIKST